MNTDTPALRNFTAIQQKVNQLLSLDKITANDIADLNTMERQYLGEICTEKVRQLTGTERDRFWDKISLIIPANTKGDIWEYNHTVISNAVSAFMRKHGVMPAQGVIAEKTGLSRQTVAKHFKEYQLHPQYTAQLEQFKLMAPDLLANVFKFASNGDTKAARLYFEMIGAINRKHTGTVVNEQNNYIQINNTTLSQENLKQLSAEQLNQIERIVINR